MISVQKGAQKREFERNKARLCVLTQVLNPEAKITYYTMGSASTRYYQNLRIEELKIVEKMTRAEQENELTRLNEFFTQLIGSNARNVPQESARSGNGLEAMPPDGDA